MTKITWHSRSGCAVDMVSRELCIFCWYILTTIVPSVFSKPFVVLEKLLLGQITPKIEEIINFSQFGFRKCLVNILNYIQFNHNSTNQKWILFTIILSISSIYSAKSLRLFCWKRSPPTSRTSSFLPSLVCERNTRLSIILYIQQSTLHEHSIVGLIESIR